MLTQWSLRSYLGKWFSVDAADSVASAQAILDVLRRVDALIVSGELPSTALAALEQRATSRHPGIAIVRIATRSGKACQPSPHVACLEKPFELAQVARLLGISGNELPHE